MTTIEFEGDAVQVDAEPIGSGLGIEPARVQPLIREGKITCRHERGKRADAGRSRPIFFLDSRRFRPLINNRGRMIKKSVVDVGDRPVPADPRGRHE